MCVYAHAYYFNFFFYSFATVYTFYSTPMALTGATRKYNYVSLCTSMNDGVGDRANMHEKIHGHVMVLYVNLLLIAIIVCGI